MQYVVYQRTESGNLVRVHDRVKLTRAQRVAQYPHAEKLQGWAERTVYWPAQSGQATGVAPLSR